MEVKDCACSHSGKREPAAAHTLFRLFRFHFPVMQCRFTSPGPPPFTAVSLQGPACDSPSRLGRWINTCDFTCALPLHLLSYP